MILATAHLYFVGAPPKTLVTAKIHYADDVPLSRKYKKSPPALLPKLQTIFLHYF